MLQVDHVNAYYGKLQVLHDLSLTIQDGERVGIFGHNGAGKTTLLKCMVGDLAQVEGQIQYQNQAILAGQVHLNVRLGMGFVPQGHNVFRELSVEQNLRIAGLLHDPAYAQTVCEIFPILKERKTQIAGSLSGGQQQMLALGMSLMTRPRLLLLDEPTTGLAPIIVKDVLASIRDINEKEGTTVLVVEQNVQATLKQVNRAIVLKSAPPTTTTTPTTTTPTTTPTPMTPDAENAPIPGSEHKSSAVFGTVARGRTSRRAGAIS